MKQEVLDKITAAMDKIAFLFLEDNEIIFRDEIERKTLKYSFLQELKNLKKNNTCIFEGCNSLSILRSHTIQKSASLKFISENGHTMRPFFHPDKEKLSIELIGDNEAFTFPGFCEVHEKLFENFESKKNLTEPEHFKLQIYRTICREVVQKKINIKILEKRLKQYLEHRDQRLGELIQKEINSELSKDNNFKFKGAKFELHDNRKKRAEDELNHARSDLNNFLQKFKTGISKDILQGRNSKIFGKVLNLDVTIPVALAGRANFRIMRNNKTRNINVIVNVLPFDGYTYIVISGLIRDKIDIEYYIKYFEVPLNVINMIEAWMVHGSDHWFIKPSVWKKIKPIYQDKILKDIFDTSRNIGQSYELSIFNDVRRHALDFLKTNADQLPKEYKKIIEAEEAKLTD